MSATISNSAVNATAEQIKLPEYQVINLQDSKNHPILRVRSTEYKFPLSDQDIKDLKTLEMKFNSEQNASGLAAPQIGITKRAFIIAAPDTPELKKWRPDLIQTLPKTIFINPTYEPIGTDMHEDYEACFSVGDVAAIVKRYKKIKYQAYNIDGKQVFGTLEGFVARIFQHETDHIDGVLFIDRAEKKAIFNIEEYRAIRKKAIESANQQ